VNPEPNSDTARHTSSRVTALTTVRPCGAPNQRRPEPGRGTHAPRGTEALNLWLMVRTSKSGSDGTVATSRGTRPSGRVERGASTQSGVRQDRRRGPLGDTWHLDELFLNIQGQRKYLWRAVDQDGDVVVDVFSSPFLVHSQPAGRLEVLERPARRPRSPVAPALRRPASRRCPAKVDDSSGDGHVSFSLVLCSFTSLFLDLDRYHHPSLLEL